MIRFGRRALPTLLLTSSTLSSSTISTFAFLPLSSPTIITKQTTNPTTPSRHPFTLQSSSSSTPKAMSTTTNPLLQEWTDQPFLLPPFTSILPSHFPPAFTLAMERHLLDLQSIIDTPSPPTFSNTIAAYDRAGGLLGRVSSVFSNFCSSLNTDELKDVQTEMVPLLSRHSSSTYFLPGLFERIDAVYRNRHNDDVDEEAGGLDPEQIRLVERLHLDFTRQGAHFTEQKKSEYADLKAQLASLCTEFAQNVMKDEESFEIILSQSDLDGCPDSLVQASRQAAQERGKDEEEYVITLSRSLVEPFLTYSPRRDLRKKVWREWSRRGELVEDRANLPIALEMLRLRKRQAELHGCKSFAEYQTMDMMAKNPGNVMELLTDVWERAKVTANKEREELEKYCETLGEDLEGGIEPWDWRYYAEKVRIAKYDFDESVFKPYLSLERVTEAVFAVSNKLYGLKYVKRDDIDSYHPDVDTYEVYQTTKLPDGTQTQTLKSIFIHDNFARKFKSSGAWMSEYRGQTKNLDSDADPMEGIPVISNNNNFAKGSGPTLLSFDDATTLFHEMGHGHHGMLSDVTYQRLAGTNVLTDFVELPSQLMEHWLEQPEVLKEYARHYETDEPVPEEMIRKFKKAKSFNQGFETIEYVSCALLDMAFHQVEDYDNFDVAKFEKEELARLGMPKGIIMRHRPAHFQHLFASSHYAAGYYVYLWAEVLDADVFGAFKETGNVFDEETAERCRKYIYSSGNTRAPDELFRLFRGRDPKIEFMLEKKGLMNN